MLTKSKKLKKKIAKAVTRLLVRRKAVADLIEPVTIDGTKYLIVVAPVYCKLIKQGEFADAN